MKKGFVKIKRAIISVSNKEGIEEFVLRLRSWNIEVIASGGTASTLREKGIEVIDVEDITGFPPLLMGRVKTLHPSIHGGILALRDKPQHISDLKQNNIEPIDLVVCDLYPFEEMARQKKDYSSCIENIDIGGITLLRAAAKNYDYVTVISNNSGFLDFLNHLDSNDGSTSHEFRRLNAIKAFSCSSNYDGQVYKWFVRDDFDKFPKEKFIKSTLKKNLPYGENSHQRAALYQTEDYDQSWANYTQHQGKDLSYNNLLDFDSSIGLILGFRDYLRPLVGIIKHTNPCGVATGKTVLEAFERAFLSDPISAFGGIVISNSSISVGVTEKIIQTFFEMIIAPSFDDESLELLSKKQNMRVVSIGKNWKSKVASDYEFRSIYQGILFQERDKNEISAKDLKLVTNRNPNNKELEDLIFAWKVVKQIKSNGIVFAKNGATIGIGSGQPSRIDSTITAIEKSEKLKEKRGMVLSPLDGAVMASDAFFPFSDSLEKAVSKGIKSVIQPGGSMRDNEVIDFANEKGISMLLTGIRAFKH
ncbi:MAG: bifunctional phosphoribosylaminoimidazolecarboxamide formyltransferase/inosine monophosphate cyclohydrolase [Rhodobacteraceae bacterium]|nr:MAG: bifunctional phosphoribosylaminoimidazolecarboxamide formyltransferase/inosine monophosphate cyclohydrolase [Paracoccaceae bacterium]